MTALPVEEWAHESVTFSHLIRPVVAYVRDHGPVPVDRVHHLILSEAAGDLRDASPARDREQAAVLALNLMCVDIDAMTLTDGIVSIPAGTTRVTSALLGEREIPTAEQREAEREASQRRMKLREWVGKNLFATKWKNGIRQRTQDEVDWMVEQITNFGFVGPKIVRDAELGTIIDGGLRFRALDVMGIDPADHTTTMDFVNDMHRLAYVVAAHSSPGGKTNIPAPLRDAILRAVVPRGSSLLRVKAGKNFHDPTPDEWLDIMGRDFAKPVVREVKAKPRAKAEAEVVQRLTSTPTPESVAVVLPLDGTAEADRAVEDSILSVMRDDEWVKQLEIAKRLIASGADVADPGRAIRRMAETGGTLERRWTDGGGAEFRKRTIRVPGMERKPRRGKPQRKRRTADGRVTLPVEPTAAKDVAARYLVDLGTSRPGVQFAANDVDTFVTEFLQSEKTQRAAYLLYDEVRGTRSWLVDGEPWTIDVERKGTGKRKTVWLRAVRG